MEIKRLNMDLGNSLTSSIINGEKEIIEIPTSLVKKTASQVADYFPDQVDKSEFRKSILIKNDDGIYLVGEVAHLKLGNDLHINNELHTKADSEVPYIMFLATAATYIVENNIRENDITINYFSTMLPIFELKQADKFSTILNTMAARFEGKHDFRILTNGHERDITLNVEESRCYAEGLTAKYAMQYKFDLSQNEAAAEFMAYHTINVDLGGGTIDMVHLQPGLKKPRSRDDFQTITEAAYLKRLKELREGKLRKYFKTARELEQFIVDKYESGSYVWINGTNGQTEDLTETITTELKEYTEEFLEIVLNTFPRLDQGQFYRYNYFGGVAPILAKYIKGYLEQKFTPEFVATYHHIEPGDNARYLNLYGLEIISIQNTIVKS